MTVETKLREEFKSKGYIFAGTDESLIESYENIHYDENRIENFVTDAIDYFNNGYTHDKGSLNEIDEVFFSNLYKN